MEFVKVLIKFVFGIRDEERINDGIVVGGCKLKEVSLEYCILISKGKNILIGNIDRIVWIVRSVWKFIYMLKGLFYREGEYVMFMYFDLGDIVIEFI